MYNSIHKNSSIFLFLIASLFILPKNVLATHAAGGEITYQWISGSTYKINYIFYRDCAGAGEPATVTLAYSSNCTPSFCSTITLNKAATTSSGAINGTEVSIGCPNSPSRCVSASSTIPGYREWVYTANITLPNQCSIWKFYTCVNARNNAINNLVTPGGQNLYVEATLNNLVAQGNSSPFFANKPTPYVCTGTPLNYSNVAIDPNNDSLVYDLIQPRTSSTVTANCATVPSDINFSSTIYNLSTNPLDCNNTFSFNPSNGQMSFTATNQQVAALTARVREYRNGVLIGSIIRDIQVIVRNCVNSISIPNFRLDTSSITGGSWVGNRIENCGGNAFTFCISSKTTTPNAKIVISSNNAISAPGSTVSYTGQWSDSVRACFSWTPSALDTGLKAISFTIKDSTCTTPNTIPIIQTYIIPVFITPVTQIIKDTVLCFGNTVQLLSVGGSQFTWSVLPGGSPLSSLSCTNCNNPIASPTVTTQYVVTSNLSSICNISKDTVTVGVAFVPFAPTTSTSNYCQGGPTSPLQATAIAGNTLVWYTTPTGGVGSATPISPSTAIVGSFNAYVSQKNSAGCESIRSVVSYFVNPVPSPPSVISPVNYCQNQTSTPLSATNSAGNTLRWYTVPTGGTFSSAPFTPSTASSGTITYYVSQFSGFCESMRVPIVVNVNPIPSSPTVTPSFVYCQGYPSTTLSAIGGTGATIKWYTSIGGTSSLFAPTPSTTTVGTTNYYATQTNTFGCESSAASITVTVNPAPSAPVVSTNVVYCQGVTATPLTATATTGNTLLWYTNAVGGTGSTTAPTPSTATAGVTNYYVSQSVGNNCESARSLISVSVVVSPSPPIASNINACVGSTLAPLTAVASTGNTLLWYTTATGGVGSAIAPTPSAITPGVTTYYVSQKNSSNCESTRTPITVTINATPSLPTVTNISYCQNATAIALTASATSGNTLNWYFSNVGGTPSSSIIPSTTTVGSTSYYVSQLNSFGCESQRATLIVTVNANPAPPIVSSVSYCQGATATALTATASTGNTLNWFGTNATGGTASSTAPIPITASVGTTTYYVSQSNSAGCQSTRAALTVIVATTPSAPVTNAVSYCQNSIASSLTATTSPGCTLNWYGTNATGGTPSAVAPIPTTNLTGTTTYYVSQQIGTCESPRASILVTINPSPPAPITSNLSFCQNVAPSIMTATALPGHTLRWYGTNATGGTFTLVPPVISTSTVGTTTYYVSQVNSFGCESVRASIVVVIGGLPAPPIVNPITYCQGATALPLIATALINHTLNWYGTNATGGVASLTAPTPLTTTFGTTNYYVSQVSSIGCESPRAQIVVNVNSTPSLPLVTPVTYCQNATPTALTATLNGGTNLNWYGTNATGGTASALAPTPSTSTIGSITYYVSQSSGASCESARAPIVVTVNPTPNAPLVVGNLTYCLNTTAVPLSATAAPGNTLWWYTTATGGVGSTTSIIPSTNTVGTITYYVSQKTAAGCESNRTAINVTTAPLPSAPSVTPISYCLGTTANPLSALASPGHTLNWYGTNATGGTASITAPIPTTNIVGTTTYYVSQSNSSGCESSRAAILITINPVPSAPIVSALTYCQNTSVPALTAIASTGNTLNWYGTNAVGGTASATAPTPSTSTIGITTYYVSQTNSFGCESPRSALIVDVNLTPPLPVVTPVSYCQNASTNALTAGTIANATLIWYGSNATGGVGTATAPIPTSTTLGITNYYVSQTTGTGCESGRSLIVVTVNPNPIAPVVNNLTYCQNEVAPSLVALAASGNTLNWYGTNATGGTASVSAPVPSTLNVGSTLFYVSQTNSFGCESPRASLTVNILPTPGAPVVSNVSYCQGAITLPLSATASSNCTLNWYTSASGGSASTNAPTPSSSTVGVANYYVSQTNTAGCESPRALLSVTINTTPVAPSVNNITYCQNATTVSLTASGTFGNSFLWYNQSSGGVGSVMAPIPSSSVLGITNYYVSQITPLGCEGPRSLIQVNVVDNPTVSIVAQGPTTFCDGDSVKLIATATPNVSYQWFNNGVLIPNSNQQLITITSSGLYTVRVTNANGCIANSNSILVFVRTLPKVISASGPLTFCSGDSVLLSVPILTNVTYQWKFNNNNIINGISNQLIVRQSGVYTVSIQDVFGCASNSIPVVVSVNNNPIVNLSPINTIVCDGSSVDLTATSSMPGTYTWFLNNQITSSLVGASPSVTLPGSYKVQVNSAANCKGMSNSVTVQTVPLPTVQLPKVIKLTYGQEISVNAIVTNADKIAWSPANIVSCVNCFNTIVAPAVTTTITATVFNTLNCSSFDTMLVIVSCDPKFLFVPNLFSPNADGENDFFYPRAKFDAYIPLMQVYNRLGELVFEKRDFKANNIEDSWNGYFKGSLADPGVYRYFIKATCADGTSFDYNGDITLIQ